MTSTITTPEDLLVDELSGLAYVEQTAQRALAAAAVDAHHEGLAERLRAHARESRHHAERIDEAFRLLGRSERAEPRAGVDGIVEEYRTRVAEVDDPTLNDIAAAAGFDDRLERYAIAAYDAAIALAEHCGHERVAALLRDSRAEDEAMLRDSTELARLLLDRAGASDRAVDHDRQPGVPPQANDDYRDPDDQASAASFPSSDPPSRW